MTRYHIDRSETYKGVPVSVIAMMYDYVKNHGGTFDGDYARGVIDGALYVTEKFEKEFEKELRRQIIGIEVEE